MDPEARQRQLFALVRRLIEARSRRAPTVILLEDLHWIDAGSEALLVALVEGVAATRTLLVTTSRPEHRPPWGGTSSAMQPEIQSGPRRTLDSTSGEPYYSSLALLRTP